MPSYLSRLSMEFFKLLSDDGFAILISKSFLQKFILSIRLSVCVFIPTAVGINTHTESLIESINFYKKDLDISIANPSSDNNLKNSIDSLDKYDGMIWGGSSLNIYNDTDEIRRQISLSLIHI